MKHTLAPLEALVAHLPPDLAERRLTSARAEAVLMQGVVDAVTAGSSQRAALREAFPGKAPGNLHTRFRRFVDHGVVGLLNTYIPEPKVVLTPEVQTRILGMTDLDPAVTSARIVELLAKSNLVVGQSTVDEFRREAGIAQPRGPRPGHTARSNAEPLATAGTMFLLAAEAELGAVASLTRALGKHLEGLPEPLDEPLDDTADRDGYGRFLPSYNAVEPREESELGAKFETSRRRAGEKNLPAMRAAQSSFTARYRKDLTMTLLPVYVETARWSSLRHWSGEHLGGIVGIAYQPATLDKYARELKFSGASVAAREEVTDFWANTQLHGLEAPTNLVLVYTDVSVKPLWTRSFAKSAKVSGTGRVMPAISTMFLHDGAGTPLVYRSFSGTVSLSQEVTGVLRKVEEAMGEGTVRRVVVMDREGHSVVLFKELISRGWDFITPLRSSVLGPSSTLEEVGAWHPYGDTDDEVCEATLSLRDRRPGEVDLQIRVVKRRRGRTGKEFCLATPVSSDEFTASAVMRMYFDRWPLQEHVFRDGKGRLGLDVHHGYGKEKMTNYAVIDKLERTEAQLERLGGQLEAMSKQAVVLSDSMRSAEQVEQALQVELDATRAALEAATRKQAAPAALLKLREHETEVQSALHDNTIRHCALERGSAKLGDRRASLEATLNATEQKLGSLLGQREIYTVDVELDEVMMAYKLTFLNMAKHVMRQYLGATMEVDTLIRSVLTLPGERVLTAKRETIRIYAPRRDPKTIRVVEEGCARVNALGLRRNDRELRFELVTAAGG